MNRDRRRLGYFRLIVDSKGYLHKLKHGHPVPIGCVEIKDVTVYEDSVFLRKMFWGCPIYRSVIFVGGDNGEPDDQPKKA